MEKYFNFNGCETLKDVESVVLWGLRGESLVDTNDVAVQSSELKEFFYEDIETFVDMVPILIDGRQSFAMVWVHQLRCVPSGDIVYSYLVV